MYNYKLVMEYDGSKYSGWQKQGNTDNTIQGRIEKVLEKMSGYYVELHGAGRTDAGVHAMGQVANFKLNSHMDAKAIESYLNKYLPKDIRINSCEEIDERFHARLNAQRKHYRYSVCIGEKSSVFIRNYCAHFPGEYNIANMKKTALYMVGTQDYKVFCDNKHMKKSTIRTVYNIEINATEDMLVFDFYGNGFLYHMVRLMSGALLKVGRGETTCDEIQDLLKGIKKRGESMLAPAQGLCLVEVVY